MALQANALVSVDEVFAYLRITTPPSSDPQYQLIEALINRASDECENYVNGPIVNKTITEKLDGTGTDTKVLTYTPVQSVTSVKLDGVDITSNVDFYSYGVIFTKDKTPFTEGRKNIDITYTAGYGTTKDTIPQNLKHACLLIVHYFYKRDALDYSNTYGESEVIAGRVMFPAAASRILDAYRRVWV